MKFPSSLSLLFYIISVALSISLKKLRVTNYDLCSITAKAACGQSTKHPVKTTASLPLKNRLQSLLKVGFPGDCFFQIFFSISKFDFILYQNTPENK